MASNAQHQPRGYISPDAPAVLRGLMAVYRFFASVKLAVISIGTLAATLAYATFYEKEHGSPATQQEVYQSAFFQILLGFLAINIFCAASIRFPWKRRQLGFVVTHIGLLVLIAGSWVGFKNSDEGQAGTIEGGTIDKLVRTQDPLVRIRPIDRKTGLSEGEFELPFKGGTFDWPTGKYQLISQPRDPFKIAVKEYYASSVGKHVHVQGKTGSPMLRIRPLMKAPGATDFADVFRSKEERWLTIPPGSMGMRASRSAGPAKFAFLYADDQRVVNDFVDPPKNPGKLGVARLHYADKNGKPRAFELRIDDAKPNEPFALPDSDLVATYVGLDERETDNPTMVAILGESILRLVSIKVRKGSGPDIEHKGYAYQPSIEPILPTEKGLKPPEPLVSICYYRPPDLGGGAGMMGNFGVVEVMGNPDGKLYYRVFGRDSTPASAGEVPVPKPGVLKASGPLKLDESITAFGGNANMPMTLKFSVEQLLTSGEEKTIYEPLVLPVGQRGNGLAAALLEMTVDGETKEFWVHRPATLEAAYDDVSFKSKDFQIAYDCDRKPLEFTIKLEDFDREFEPGTEQPTRFVSKIRLTDEKLGIKDKPITISMNNPLTHRKLTFYQSSYIPERDPQTGQETGDFQSVFQVGYDAGRPLKYLGSAFIVLGAFLQFYMRAGLFTDGGKRDDLKAADRARKLLTRKGKPQPTAKEKPQRSQRSKNHDEAIL